MLHYYLEPPSSVYEAGERPFARPVARLQAARGLPVTNGRHESEPLDDLLCHIVQRLNGQNDRESLVQTVKRAIEAGTISAIRQRDRLYDIDPNNVETIVDLALVSIARMSLLVG